MTPKEYVEAVMQYNHEDLSEPMERYNNEEVFQLDHALQGMSSELGEFADVLKRHINYGVDIDWINLGEELGDIMWYVALASQTIEKNTGKDLNYWMEKNYKKCQNRHGSKFSKDTAINRDKIKERQVLEDD
jgi:NTP pyrophosphatase (non-canonical NTP hydrolase)